jgi:hypothetical protein
MVSRRWPVLGAGAAPVAGGAAALLAGGGGYDEASAAMRALAPATGPDDAAWLVGHAILAANSHNTQPWQFRPGP